MSCYTDKNSFYSHKDKKLITHLKKVGEISKEIFQQTDIDNKEFYTQLSFLIGICHDFGKATSYFQKHLQDETYKSTYANHSLLSAFFCYYVIKNLLDNTSYNCENYPIMSYLVINHHHGNLKNLIEAPSEITALDKDINTEKQIEDLEKHKNTNEYLEIRKFYKDECNIDINDFIESYFLIKENINDDLFTLSMEESMMNYEEIIMLYSVLLDSDKFDASETQNLPRKDKLPSQIISNYKKSKFGEIKGINKIREEAYKEVMCYVDKLDLNNKLYSLTLPTGIGKTLDIFAFALRLRERIQKEKNITPRILYVLPFLSIIDQTETVLNNILEKSNIKGNDYLLVQTSLSDTTYNTSEDESITGYSSELLIDGWYSEIVITTSIQFFYSIISNKNKSLRKFHNLIDSIVILDEVQSIPIKYWNIIATILKDIAYNYHVWIILMTATQPLIFNPEHIYEIIENKQFYFQKFNRIEYYFHKEPVDLKEFCQQASNIIENNKNKDIMFVVNTIHCSRILYNHISNNINVSDKELIYLSTNIVPKDRRDRIDKIEKKSNKQKIIVTTQLIEAGVDIDVDIIYRDFAPIDSIIQTAGRCNRNNNNGKGEVHIIKLKDDQNRYFYNMIYDSVLISATDELINNLDSTNNDIITASENEFNLKIPNEYYKILKDRISQEQSDKLNEKISNLELETIPNDFKLIENLDNPVNVFIEKDKSAERLWADYISICENSNKMESRQKFREIRSDFYSYIIHIPKYKTGADFHDNEKTIVNIPRDELTRKYDEETGFIPKKEQDPNIW
ncbi:CRISPR-associated helicase Cas3' [Methanosphaera sp. Vir-13MRS]|uniref:CRISPR-associated helicase Cas3' n=1 Tax=Candidatus Methanosphaera massiliense TaxID=3017187 RepID=UPI00237FF345|nr:CRISPR-associated helicase Cas3' [Candidatus Methanosphaera massiliense]MDE4078676.1 CRISPR-associated helicase Cas3' [Candidatus Methanosphaera massiliense]